MKLTPATYMTRWRNTLVFSLSFFFPIFFISRNSKTLKNWGNLCLCFIFLVSVNVQESMKSFFLFYSIFLLTRRCGSVYLGVVVPRVWYFEHALLQLNSCHHILPEKINHLLYLFAEPQLIQYVPIHNNNPLTSWQCLEICTSSMPTCLEPNCNIGHEWLQPGE